MSELRNVSNGQIYALYWAIYANARPEIVAVPKDLSLNIVRNANRMDYVSISADAIQAVKASASTRMDP